MAKDRMTIAEVLALAREGKLDGTWEGGSDGVFVRVSNERLETMTDSQRRAKVEAMAQQDASPQEADVARDKLATMRRAPDARPAAVGEGQPPPMDMWMDATIVEPQRPSRTAYVDEAAAMQGVPPRAPTRLPGDAAPPRMQYGPYRGQLITDVPTPALAEMRTLFENGAPPEVEAELRRRGV